MYGHISTKLSILMLNKFFLIPFNFSIIQRSNILDPLTAQRLPFILSSSQFTGIHNAMSHCYSILPFDPSRSNNFINTLPVSNMTSLSFPIPSTQSPNSSSSPPWLEAALRSSINGSIMDNLRIQQDQSNETKEQGNDLGMCIVVDAFVYHHLLFTTFHVAPSCHCSVKHITVAILFC